MVDPMMLVSKKRRAQRKDTHRDLQKPNMHYLSADLHRLVQHLSHKVSDLWGLRIRETN